MPKVRSPQQTSRMPNQSKGQQWPQTPVKMTIPTSETTQTRNLPQFFFAYLPLGLKPELDSEP